MHKHIVQIGALIAVVGCDEVRNPEFCGDGFCSDQSLPFCDKDGTIGPLKQPDTCIAVSCQPGEFISCRGDETIACNSAGDNFDILECASGCIEGAATCTPCSPGETRCREDFVESCGDSGVFEVAENCRVTCISAPAPHCAYVEPKYIPDSCDVPATADTLTFPNASFDTGNDLGCTGGVITQNGGPEICMVRAASILIPSGATVTVVGPRALALVADTALEVAGVLDVSASSFVNGPGADIGVTGRGASLTGTSSAAGGAGFATPGAAGGTLTTVGDGGAGGPASTNPALLSTLIGGSKGGGDMGGIDDGGGGGGAVMLIACRGKVTITGTIDAGGGGANAATGVVVGGFIQGSPGHGGGSGGNVVIQGIDVEVTGMMFANGGGGSSGNNASTTVGNPGRDGGSIPGMGALGPRNNGGGGSGGSASQAPLPGEPPIGGLPRTAGGGGGSVGFLQTYTPKDITPTLNPAAQSPMLQPNLEARTR